MLMHTSHLSHSEEHSPKTTSHTHLHFVWDNTTMHMHVIFAVLYPRGGIYVGTGKKRFYIIFAVRLGYLRFTRGT